MIDLEKYALVDWRKAKITKLNNDRKPQFEQDMNNCWFYSMCNNAYFNLGGFTLGDVIDVRTIMKKDGIKFHVGGNAIVSGAYIARYLSKKLGKEIRCFNISFHDDTLAMADLLKKGYCFEMSRISSPKIFSDNDKDGIINEIHYYGENTGFHSVNICFDEDKKLFKELGTWGNESKHNEMYYDLLKFGQCIKTRAISSDFNFLAELDD